MHVHFSAGKKFNSATAFSMHCKRQQTPNKQGDDGWKSVQYEGTQLDVFRRKFVQQSSVEETEVEFVFFCSVYTPVEER